MLISIKQMMIFGEQGIDLAVLCYDKDIFKKSDENKILFKTIY